MVDSNLEALMYGAPTPNQKAILNEAMALGLDFLSGEARGGKVIDYRSEADLRKVLALDLPRTGTPMPDLLAEMRDTVVRFSVAQGDPRYLAFPDTGTRLPPVGGHYRQHLPTRTLLPSTAAPRRQP